MKKKTVKYSNEPLRRIKIVDDFLPKPENLVFKDEIVIVNVIDDHQALNIVKKLVKT